jgi:hypothetical protein
MSRVRFAWHLPDVFDCDLPQNKLNLWSRNWHCCAPLESERSLHDVPLGASHDLHLMYWRCADDPLLNLGLVWVRSVLWRESGTVCRRFL